ncbi:hypothetical protein MESS2_1640024 [Mesorhizobium metallidurans STM 2683]|uniref:DDE domain-containing protein n=1 Tax=Mesorhizobium metallidurans STM 2683 TaxID=1297569 RepID=M5F1L0_9HYPH|nr:hypothetical protein MESS2_1640024 [Mesorhizobium metallidurans STM 2683]
MPDTDHEAMRDLIRLRSVVLWRAVDQEGFVFDVLMQSRRNARAERRLMRKLLKGQGRSPRAMITDKLGSYAMAGREMMPDVEHSGTRSLTTGPKTPISPPDAENRS